MNEVIIFTTTLADETWEILVVVDVLTNLTPQAIEGSEKKIKALDTSKALKWITYGTEPVKLIPLKYGDEVIASPKTGPSAGMKF